MYQCCKKLVPYKEYTCFDHSGFPAYSMFRFDVCWGSLGTSVLENSSSAANHTWSVLTSRLSFRFLWLWFKVGDQIRISKHKKIFRIRSKFFINFSRLQRKFCLSLHYSEGKSLLFVNATKIYHFKAKDTKIPYHLGIGNILKDYM